MAIDTVQASQQLAASTRSAAIAEWRAHWPLAFAAMSGLSFASIAAYSMGLFMDPLSQEFGWTRAQISIGLTIFSAFAVPMGPFVGALIDRWGPRRLAIPGIILAGAAYASLSLANGSFAQWIGLWVFYAAAALLIKTTVWTAGVASVFTASRGLALAVALCGTAVAQTFAPLLAQWIIDNHGWRSAYLWVGLGWGAFVLVLLVCFFFGASDRKRIDTGKGTAAPAAAAVVLRGLSPREAMRNSALIKIACVLLINSIIGTALAVHKVPILTEAGVTRQLAAVMAATAGVAGICGKVMTGWLMDRWSTGWIPGISLALPSVALLLLLEPFRTQELILLSMVLLGYAAGASFQVTTYQTSRHAGLLHFGKIFGFMTSMIGLGTGLGPLIAGFIHDQFGTYLPLLIGGIPATLICGFLVGRLGPYPDWSTPRPQAAAGHA